MACQQLIQRHYLRIIQQWPKDPLRPDISFSNALQKRLAERFPGNDASTPASSTTAAPTVIDEAKELAQINALDSLLENRYSNAVSYTY